MSPDRQPRPFTFQFPAAKLRAWHNPSCGFTKGTSATPPTCAQSQAHSHSSGEAAGCALAEFNWDFAHNDPPSLRSHWVLRNLKPDSSSEVFIVDFGAERKLSGRSGCDHKPRRPPVRQLGLGFGSVHYTPKCNPSARQPPFFGSRKRRPACRELITKLVTDCGWGEWYCAACPGIGEH